MKTTRPFTSAISRRCLPAFAFAALGAGCVGHNHILFVTKSNVGLDLDSKPPTTEVTIARKEGVIAPSFDEGKTPPVMASFHTRAGNGGGFKSFFFGVDQTFAGGDAAVTMATLYDAPSAPDAASSSANPLFKSALTVQKPTATAWWKKIPEPGTATPFVFATDTLVGVKIGWSSVGQVPDSLKIGFNRKEFAWAPLSQSVETTDSAGTKSVTIDSPSFIATVDSKTTGEGTSSSTGTLQYFATGTAASRLALQPAVRRAMLSRLDPSFHAQFGVAVLGETLVLLNSVIANRASAGDILAQGHLARLQALHGITLPAVPGPRFAFDQTGKTLTQLANDDAFSAQNLTGLITYNDFLETNRSQLNAAWQALAAGELATYAPAGAAPTQDKRQIADALLAAQTQTSRELDQFRAQLSSNQDIVNADLFVLGLIAPR